MRYNFKRSHVEKKLSAGCHTLDEVMDYIVNTYGFVKADKDEVLEEYRQMRALSLIRCAPELLGKDATISKIKSTEEKDVREFLEKSKQRNQKAMEIPVTDFDIDFHKFTKRYFPILRSNPRGHRV